MKKNTLVSVIIPTKNSERTLDKCLKSIKQQSYKNIEIIIVDQKSNDNTIEIAEKYKAKIINLPKPKFYSPPSKSRNIGAKISGGSILYHLDSDMELSNNLIQEIVEIFEKDDNIGALIVHEKDKSIGFWSKCKALERKSYWNNDKIESARVVSKEIFDKVGGYDEQIGSGEDFDIHKKYKEICKIGFCKNIVIHNLDKINFIKQIEKKYFYGKTAKYFLNKYKNSSNLIIYEELKSYYNNKGDFLKNPFIGIGVIFLKFSEYVALNAGIMVGHNNQNIKRIYYENGE